MKRRAAAFVVAAGIAAASLVTAPTASATQTADQARQQCQAALDNLHARNGVCFWPNEYWDGPIDVHADPKPRPICGNLSQPAQSVVNLTNDSREMYRFSDCDGNGFIRQVHPGNAETGFDGTIHSWR